MRPTFRVSGTGAKQPIVALAGNPNTGKSTVFNALTGLRQHTGNWPGKTVLHAEGTCIHNGHKYTLIDLPGTYSLLANSADEEVARDFICFAKPDATVVVVDATCLERNLNLALQVIEITGKVILCVNLIDEARRKKLVINTNKLSKQLGVPVVTTSARNGEGLPELMNTIGKVVSGVLTPKPKPVYFGDDVAGIYNRAENITKEVVSHAPSENKDWDHHIDNIVTSKILGFPIMFAILAVVFWLTISGANLPSNLLATGFFWVEGRLTDLFMAMNSPAWLHGFLVLGIYRGVAWVVSVMLPPMAIFFPMFTLLEDMGYLPRVAFNLDRFFKKAGAHGKQALTMCMGFGCNAAGVIACRIIESPRERLIAIITNTFAPCNGRFPTLIALASIFVAGSVTVSIGNLPATLAVTGLVVLGIIITLLVSWLLSKTLLRGESSSFTLELPPYRRPLIGQVIVRSVLDRTLFVLGRAVIIAAPAGGLVWFLANTTFGGGSLLTALAGWLNPFANLMGLDGFILLAFILGLPANEIVLPILIMSYVAGGAMVEFETLADLRHLLVIEHGWTWLTALCTMIFTLCHWPCGTTLYTIQKEQKDFRWTMLSALIPTGIGIIICLVINNFVRAFHLI
ncbi:MAG TPA: ferrous iron transporter B [Clostridia bacterium]|nr:ferrous iron transporter B [Clostridia bacterium]